VRCAVCKKIEIPLDIENIDIKDVKFTDNNEILITLESTVEGTHCHCCGKFIKKYHGCSRELKLQHLPILGKKTYLYIKPRRYICEFCDNNPTTTQKLSWTNERSQYTKEYEQHILLMLINSTVSDVSKKEGITYDSIEGVLNRLVDLKVDWHKIKSLTTIGIDEVSLKKGHSHFVTIVTSVEDEGTIRLLAVLPNREKDTVKRFFLSIPNELRSTIRNVCTDLYEGYMNAAQEILGDNVNIIADRFHVTRLYRKAVDKLRITELKRLKKELPKESYKKLHNIMWIIRKKPEKLSIEDKNSLKLLAEWSHTLILAYLFSCQLTRIFDKLLTSSEAKEEIMAWASLIISSDLTCFDTFLKTLAKNIKPITNYFIERLNSGFVEGFNNKIKLIKRRCYGIFNITHLFQRISLDLAGYT
jgi:transposase